MVYKKDFFITHPAFDFVDVIGAARIDTATYELPPLPTGKRGRPRKKGDRIDYKKLVYTKEDSSSDLLQATV